MGQVLGRETNVDLPEDLLLEMLLRLPVKSLLRFRCVCRNWNSLIKGPKFILAHLNQTKDQTISESMLILRSVRVKYRLGYTKIVLSLLSDETLNPSINLDLEMLSPSLAMMNERTSNFVSPTVRISGPSNGLFCLTDNIDIMIFNPATRESMLVPHSPMLNFNQKNKILYLDVIGFGFDPIAYDYKVLRISVMERFESSLEDRHCKVIIFSLRNACWRELNLIVPCYLFRNTGFPLFYNNFFHYAGVGPSDNVHSIIAFDCKNEDFKQIPLPFKYSALPLNEYLSLAIFDNSLALVSQRKLGLELNFNIWVMKEYGNEETWSLLFNIGPMVGVYRPLSFGKDSEFLLVNNNGQLISLNLNTMVVKKFEVRGITRSVQAFRYRESLIPINNFGEAGFENIV